MKVNLELDLAKSNGFPFLHEEVVEIPDERSKVRSVSISLTRTELYFWPKEGSGFHRLNLVPIIQAVVGALSPEEGTDERDLSP